MEFLLARSAASNEATGRGLSFCSWIAILGSPGAESGWFVPPLPLALGFLARSIGQRVAALALSGNRPSLAARARQRLLEGVAFALMLSGCATLPPHPPRAQDTAAPAAPNGASARLCRADRRRHGEHGDGALAPRSERSRAERPARAGGRSRRDPRCPVLSSGRTTRAARCSRSVCSTRPIAASRCDCCSTTSRSRRAAALVARLDAHPSIEVRVFNPWASRGSMFGVAVEFLARTKTLNRRMHNKAYIADGRFAILGGRNIGDRYFGVYEPFVEDDLDLLVSGPVVAERDRELRGVLEQPRDVSDRAVRLARSEGGRRRRTRGSAETIAAAGPRLAAFTTTPAAGASSSTGWSARSPRDRPCYSTTRADADRAAHAPSAPRGARRDGAARGADLFPVLHPRLSVSRADSDPRCAWRARRDRDELARVQ